MTRHPQNPGYAGSQLWLQTVVNECPLLLNRKICRRVVSPPGQIQWLSPLESDSYAEYSDETFLHRLEIRLYKTPLGKFWPPRGPQWDALGWAYPGKILIAEAKSRINELRSSGTASTGKSAQLIRRSLDETKKYMGVDSSIEWATSRYYQYANRLAHLYLLRVLNELPAYLITLYFLNDEEMNGPSEISEWKSAIAEEEEALGIPPRHHLDRYIIPVFVDVRDIPVK